ncbi:MAG: hypothetical protein O3A26_04305 [Proteobacteria bacterium]|nr:hypothetical protein [Pseudomonadota bacterium]
MFEVRIVSEGFEKESRMSEEELAVFLSKFVIRQAKTMGYAKTSLLSADTIFHWHLCYIQNGYNKDCQAVSN